MPPTPPRLEQNGHDLQDSPPEWRAHIRSNYDVSAHRVRAGITLPKQVPAVVGLGQAFRTTGTLNPAGPAGGVYRTARR